MSRKERRKEQRKAKKQRKTEYFSKRAERFRIRNQGEPGRFVRIHPHQKSELQTSKCHKSTKVNTQEGKKGRSLEMETDEKCDKLSISSQADELTKEILKDKKKHVELSREMKKQRIKQLQDANVTEDKTIKLLEKRLKLNKRKKKSIPKSFAESGLDYILEVCDSEKNQGAIAEMNFLDSESEFEDDLAVITGKKSIKDKVKEKNRDISMPYNNEKSDSECSVESDCEKESLHKEDSLCDDSDDVCQNDIGDDCENDSDDICENDSDDICENDSDDVCENDSDENDLDGEFNSDGSSDSPVEMPSRKNTQKRPAENSFVGNNKRVKTISFLKDDELVDNSDLENDSGKLENENDTWEDIYGRKRDKEGNIVKETTDKYVPPHLKAKNLNADQKKKEELERLTKQLKGLLNRLAENNMYSISNQIDEMYMSHSRSDMNETLMTLFKDSLVSYVHTPERLIMEHAMLLAVLHANVGTEVGAFMLQNFGKTFCELHSADQTIENKKVDNVLLLLCHMYTFKIFDSVLLYDILNLLCNRFAPKDIDLILVILRSVGFTLRKDNPLALKEFIIRVQKLANEATTLKDDSRVRFMLDALLSIKNNNMSKLPQYDPTHSEHLKKLIKPMFRKGNYVTEMKISLEDLIKADERGRWWIVGSAWNGPSPQAEKKVQETPAVDCNLFSEELLNLAKKQRMNTSNRKNIFCILMSAEDYIDAFEKLLRLGLKGQPEQEIIHVLIHCLLQEKIYNPYYSYIAEQLCMSDRRHRMTLQYSLWDRFKEVKSLSHNQITNLAKFLAHLILQNTLPLSVLKVLEFTELDKRSVKLLRQVLLTLLLQDDKDALLAVFSKISKTPKLQFFRESIRLFMHHFLLRNMKHSDSEEEAKLKDRIALVEQTFQVFDSY